ncbi:hypothetical protein AAMO2058_000103800 [Amorphochlora amoebiformis]
MSGMEGKHGDRVRCVAILDFVPWVGDNQSVTCQECKAPFSLVVRRHHCRVCGFLLCGSCSPYRTYIPSSVVASIGPFRTCKMCNECVVDFTRQLDKWRRKRQQNRKRPSTNRSTPERKENLRIERFFNTIRQGFSGMFQRSPAITPPPTPTIRTPRQPVTPFPAERNIASSLAITPESKRRVLVVSQDSGLISSGSLLSSQPPSHVNPQHPPPKGARSRSLPCSPPSSKGTPPSRKIRARLFVPSTAQWDRLWQLAISDWHTKHLHRSKLAGFWLWRGLTPTGQHRTRYWEVASGSQLLRLQNKGLYISLLEKARVVLRQCHNNEAPKEVKMAIYKIQRDVPRSMPCGEYKRFFITNKKVEPMLRALSSSPKDFAARLKLVSTDLESLYNILLAYCMYEHHKGHYCQGMNYIVACMLMAYSGILRQNTHNRRKFNSNRNVPANNLLSRQNSIISASSELQHSRPSDKRDKDTPAHPTRRSHSFETISPSERLKLRTVVEERCFWLLTTLLDGYGVGSLYCSKSNTLAGCLDSFSKTATMVIPNVMKRLHQHQVLPLMYAMEWFTTLFSYSMPTTTVWEIWDLLLLEGFGLLHLIGVAVLITLQDVLMTGHPEKLLEILRKQTWRITGAQIRKVCLRLAKDPPQFQTLYSRACVSTTKHRPLVVDMNESKVPSSDSTSFAGSSKVEGHAQS